jgi:hypothetical protein
MQEQDKFKYIYNNEEVSREDFEKLAGDSFKWFDGDSIVSVPFSSFDSFFDGDFKSVGQINEHLKEVLDLEKLVDSSIESRFNSILSFSNKPQEKNTNSTRHKSQAGETHHFKTNIKQKEKLNTLRQYLLSQPEIQNDFEKTTKVFLSETEEELKSMISAEKEKTEEKDIVLNRDYPEKLGWQIKRGRVTNYSNSKEKGDVITNSNRGEKETLQGIKESQSVDKAPIFTYCKVNKNALEALAFRALYGHKKYNKNGEDEDWQNFTRVPNAEEEYANAEFRHALEIGGEETTEEHLIASAWNAVSRLEIFLRKKSK